MRSIKQRIDEAAGTSATITLYADENVRSGISLNTANTNITLIGDGGEKTIISAVNQLFTVRSNASLTLGNNVTLTMGGISNPTGPLIAVDEASSTARAQLFMESGSKITGYSANGSSGVIRIDRGTFTMNGGSITGNTGKEGNIVVSGFDSIFNLSGNKSVGILTLKNSAAITLIGVFTGSVDRLNLRHAYIDAGFATGVGNLVGRAVIKGGGSYTITASDIAKFSLGDFIGAEETTQPISTYNGGYHIEASGPDIGKLLANE